MLFQQAGGVAAGFAVVAAGQLGQLRLAGLSVPQGGHARVGKAVHHLLAHPEMVIGGGGHQGLVGHAEHLALAGQTAQ